MASTMKASNNTTTSIHVNSIVKRGPAVAQDSPLPVQQVFEVLSSTFAVAKIQQLPIEDDAPPLPPGGWKGGPAARVGGGAGAGVRADLELVREVFGRPQISASACFAGSGPTRGMETVFGGPDPGADVFVESSLQILTVSEADGINKGARSGDLLQGVKAGMWGTDASNAASNVFPGFVVAKRSKASKRVVSRAAFVKVPRGCVTLPKESVAALMEIVEQRLHADRLVVVVERLQDDEALRKAWVRAFTMIGFEMINPSAMPFNSDKFLLLACDF